MDIIKQRIYQTEGQPAGFRILIDRIWPRGISKEKADLNDWAKEIAPSTDLRKWFGHDPEKFVEFREKYIIELEKNSATADFINLVKKELKTEDVLFLYSAKDEEHNNAIVLKEYVKEQM